MPQSISGQQFRYNISGHVGQPEIAPLAAEGQPLVIQTKAVEQGCVQIVHVDFVFDDVECQIVGLADRLPPLIPPPATHMLNARRWWSRPRLSLASGLRFSTIGVRPNSPPQTTSV